MPTVIDRRLRVSDERPLVRWAVLGCIWLLVAAITVFDTLAVRDYAKLLEDSTMQPGDALVLKRTLPAAYADVQQWTRLALEHDSGWPVRYTKLDNAPRGREVHWNSGFVHLIRFAGWLRRSFTNESTAAATEGALAWFNLPVFLAIVAFFSAWVTRRSGVGAGALVAIGMVGHRFFYDGFAPNNVDHHGLLNAAAFGVILGGAYMCGGWRLRDDRRSARGAAVLSAACGALGMWVSAASTIPVIALTGVGGVVASWFADAHDDGDTLYDGDLWRLWGRVGAAIAFVAYLIEYAPNHLGMRLEVNHPLYALAWLGGGELIAAIGEWRQRERRVSAWRVVCAAAALVAPALVIVVARSRVFLPLDPQLARLHAFIDEFNPLSAFVRRFGVAYLSRYLLSFVFVLPAALAFQRKQPARGALLLAATTTVGLAVMGALQIRWWLPASAAQLCLLLAGVAAIRRRVSLRAAMTTLILLSIVFLQQAVWRVRVWRTNADYRSVTPLDAMQPMYRDVAARLRSTQPGGDITLLASPDASLSIGYYGGFRAIGTFYWENRDGLAASAHILSSESDDDARALILARGITHIALFSASNFLEPFLASERGSLSIDQLKRTFGHRLLVGAEPPRWLRPIPFLIRPGGPRTSVRLYQVVPDQSEFDALWANAIAKAVSGDTIAESEFDRALALHPMSQHASLLADGARELYRWGAQRLALRLYRRSAGLAPTREATLAMAWILSTSVDDSVRDGRTAVQLMEPLLKAVPGEPGVLDTYAAALAELGRFDDAVRVQASVVDSAAKGGDEAARARAEVRLAAYRGGQAWRQ